MEQKPKIHPAVAAIIVIVLVGIVATVAIVVANNTTDETTPATTQSENQDSQVESTDASNYKDGTYAATGTYLSPGGRESIELSVTIKDGVITETSLETNASDAEAAEYQGEFKDNYKTLVVGKKVEGLSLSRVAGSSLTSNGFNDALDAIRDEARV